MDLEKTLRRELRRRRYWNAVVAQRYGDAVPLGDPRQFVYQISGDNVPHSQKPTAVVKYVHEWRKGIREAQYALRYSGTVGPTVYDVTTDTAVLPAVEIVMETAFGSLQDAAARGVVYDTPQKMVMLAYDLAVLSYALESDGVSHCDIKPENVFLFADEERGTLSCRLGDFGLARTHHEVIQLQRSPRFYGSFGFMAPEFVSSSSHPLPDLFSYGMLLYWIVRGRLPREFDVSPTSNTPEFYARQLSSGCYKRVIDTSLPGRLHPGLRDVITLSTEPASSRPHSFKDIISILDNYC
jgi:serine/threonine protein kinase